MRDNSLSHPTITCYQVIIMNPQQSFYCIHYVTKAAKHISPTF